MTSSMPRDGSGEPGWQPPTGESEELGAPTGRYIVVFNDDVHGDQSATMDALRSVTGASSVASTSDFEAGALDVEQAKAADATVFDELGLAVVAADPNMAQSIISAADSDARVVSVEAEQILHALPPQQVMSAEYLQGFHDATEQLWKHMAGNGESARTVAETTAQFVDTPTMTWGLQATGAAEAQQSGQDALVAVLDTGFDLDHPDFKGRSNVGKSFVEGQTVQDGNGHGTHCVGTACGSQRPPNPPGSRRFGVAYGANIMSGKVLSDQGSGTDSDILAGIDWAVHNNARVISMSLGAPIKQVSRRYEAAGRRAINRGSLIVAAAGNNADRAGGNPGFVGIPANSPSIMAVAAVDPLLRIANFSARSHPETGAQVDIAAPGVQVYSSWPMKPHSGTPTRYHTINGTSMATPHVAGCAALWSQRTGATGAALWALLVRSAQRLSIPSIDVGAGLVQAPR